MEDGTAGDPVGDPVDDRVGDPGSRKEPIDAADSADATDAADAADVVGQLGLAAVGVAFEIGDRLRDAGSRFGSVASFVTRPSRQLIERLPLGGLVPEAMRRLDGLSARGRKELESTTDQGLGVVRQSAERLSRSPILPEVLGDVKPLLEPVMDAALPVALERLEVDQAGLTALVDGLLNPVLDAALPLVFERLAADPEQLVPVVDGVLDAILPKVMDKLAAQPELLSHVVDPVLPPVLDSALPEVFDRLGANPDDLVQAMNPIIDQMLEQMLPVVLARLGDQSASLRALIADQSGSLATDMANEMRARVVTGDDIVERALVKARLRRRPRAVEAATADVASSGSDGTTPSGAADTVSPGGAAALPSGNGSPEEPTS